MTETTVRAAVCAPPDPILAIEAVKLRPLGPNDVRVHVQASGVCGTDVSSLDRACGHGAGHAHPMVLGHEGAGTVLQIGDQVRNCRLGDRIITAFVPACGNCWYCIHAMSNLCEQTDQMRADQVINRADGSVARSPSGLGTFADELVVTSDAVVPVATDLPWEELALIGCGVTTGVGAVLWSAEVGVGASVAVYGCGGVGQFIVQGARVAGADRIFAVDPVPHKRDHAASRGATDLIDPTAGDPAEQILAATSGRGVDFAFEAVGSPKTIAAAYQSARRRGTAVVVGRPKLGSVVEIPAESLFRDEKRIIGSYYGSAAIRRDFPTLVALAESGQLDIGGAVSRRLKLEDVNEALDALRAGEVIRSVIC